MHNQSKCNEASAAGSTDSAGNQQIPTLADHKPAPRYADKSAVAARLGLCRRTIDNLLAAGMPHLKLGARRVRFDLAEVDAWLKQKYGTRRRGPAGGGK